MECYTYPRVIMTLSGGVNLNVHVRKCPDHKETNRKAIDALINGSDFDNRIVMAVGLLRWIMDYQRSEIHILMESRGSPYPLERYQICQGSFFSVSIAFTEDT